jgi:UDP-N-acetylglucosamine 2-epimerase
MLERIEAALVGLGPDVVVVYGDTNSTLAGALAAAKLRIPVAHIEAGLRSHNRDMPEEINRILTDHVAELLLCPSELAVVNLVGEGITAGVAMVGDLMRDALEWALAAVTDEAEVLDRYQVTSGGFSLATIHRPSNTDDAARFAEIMSALEKIGADHPVLFPVHPRTRSALDAAGVGGGVRLLQPLGHLDLVILAKHARVGLTDSGGLQKELCWLETPAVTLRRETEWPETITAGWNRLGGDSAADIVAAARAAARDRPVPSDLYGDGRAAERIEEVLVGWHDTGV